MSIRLQSNYKFFFLYSNRHFGGGFKIIILLSKTTDKTKCYHLIASTRKMTDVRQAVMEKVYLSTTPTCASH